MRKLFVGFLLYALIIGMVSISGCSNLYLSRSKDASQQDNIDIQPDNIDIQPALSPTQNLTLTQTPLVGH